MFFYRVCCVQDIISAKMKNHSILTSESGVDLSDIYVWRMEPQMLILDGACLEFFPAHLCILNIMP